MTFHAGKGAGSSLARERAMTAESRPASSVACGRPAPATDPTDGGPFGSRLNLTERSGALPGRPVGVVETTYVS